IKKCTTNVKSSDDKQKVSQNVESKQETKNYIKNKSITSKTIEPITSVIHISDERTNRTLPNKICVKSIALCALDTRMTPRAKNAVNTMPIEESFLIRLFWLTTPIPTAVISPNVTAP